MTRGRRAVFAAGLAASMLAATGHGVSASAAPPSTATAATAAAAAAPAGRDTATADRSTVRAGERASVIGADWQTSSDMLWTTAGDGSGLHLLVADANDGYTWRTVATLAEPGVESEQWIGNACLTASGKRAVVVYEPRHFSNREHLFQRGAFAAVVDIASGQVTKLDVNVSIAYHNPGCGAGEDAALTQGGATDRGRTRIHLVNTATAKITSRVEVTGQLTSAVPYDGHLAAADSGRIVSIDKAGRRTTLAKTGGTAAYLKPDAHRGLGYLEQVDGATTAVRYLSKGGTRELGRGPLTGVGLTGGTGGRLFITGSPTRLGTLPAGTRAITSATSAEISSTGAAVLTRSTPPTGRPMRGGALRVGLAAKVVATGGTVDFTVDPTARPSAKQGQGRVHSPQLRAATHGGSRRAAAAGSPSEPVDADRYCSVPRNALDAQVEQPHWKQVEWAATLAVKNALTIQRPANWHGSGLPAWSPQAMEPRIPLAGGNGTGEIPPQVMLGVIAQESNMWQASWHALEGVPGNPLVGKYYGIHSGWNINWADADCGYGVAQVTDGMRIAGHAKPGERLRPANEQKAIAMDYATNIAAGARILQEKWNSTYANMKVNNADPARIDNWFAAVWAYNSGLNPQPVTGNTTGCIPGPSCTDDRGNWGLGWGNNPANPDYPFNRYPFLDGPNGNGVGGQADAAHPERWSYPEKIMGWAAYPLVKYDYRTDTLEAGYTQAWWTTGGMRTQGIKPPLNTFCTAANNCITANGQPNGKGECRYTDYHCWWHWPAVWKTNCADTCGYANAAFQPGAPEPARGNHYPATCNTDGLPDGSLVVDDIASTAPIVRSDQCARRVANNGQFTMAFNGTASGLYPSKIDFHQIGSGVNGHFWFAHEQNQEIDAASKVKVTGTWQLNRSLNQWAKVWVHLPAGGGESQQAHYRIDRGASATPADKRIKWRVIGQHRGGNAWVSLGAFQFNGTPSVSLSNITRTGSQQAGVDNVAWDAVAFQPLPGKPKDVVVAMGDSYASGEGVVDDPDTDYYPDSNHNTTGANAFRNGCHRSPHAWARQATLAGDAQTIGQREDGRTNNMDYHMVACAGTQSEHMLPSGTNPITGKVTLDPVTGAPFKNAWGQEASGGTMREVTQLDSGFVDENTTLVTITVGGNDVGWTGIMTHCYEAIPTIVPCMEMDYEGHRLRDWVPELMEMYLRPTTVTMLRAINLLAPNAKIVLMGYPKLLSEPYDCLNLPAIVGFSDSEAEWFNQAAVEMASLQDDIAGLLRSNGINVWASNPIPKFEDRGVCGAGSGLHSLTFDGSPGEKPGLFASSSFHPNMTGGRLYRDTLNATLRGMGI